MFVSLQDRVCGGEDADQLVHVPPLQVPEGNSSQKKELLLMRSLIFTKYSSICSPPSLLHSAAAGRRVETISDD